MMLSWLAILAVAGCMEQADLGDTALREFADMRAVDRVALGFSALPQSGPVGIERRESAGYDAMLHLASPGSQRTIAFERAGGRYRWLGEQELTEPPRVLRGLG